MITGEPTEQLCCWLGHTMLLNTWLQVQQHLKDCLNTCLQI